MNCNQTMTLLFWHRKSKPDAQGKAPIYCRISIDGVDAELAIGEKILANQWNSTTKKVKSSDDAQRINLKMNEVTLDLHTIFKELKESDKLISPLWVKNSYILLAQKLKNQASPLPINQEMSKVSFDFQTFLTELKDESLDTPTCRVKNAINNIPIPANEPEQEEKPTILKAADEHIANFKKMVDKGLRSPETLKQWKATRNKIVEFVKHEYDTDDIILEEIQFSFATKLYQYLTVERKKVIGEAAAKKQIKNIKEILGVAEANNDIIKNPIQRFKCGGDETDIPPLEMYQVERLWRKDIQITRLAEVRDAFIFQCFTGFAFQDVYALTNENIVLVGIEAEPWLIKDRGKTGVSEMVPILPIVAELIEKYKDHSCRREKGQLVPVNSNARYNGYLKELATICGINRELNTHLARHTFADIMLNEMGFTLAEVGRMLGQKSIRTTQRYAKVRRQLISRSMALKKDILFTENGELRQIAV